MFVFCCDEQVVCVNCGAVGEHDMKNCPFEWLPAHTLVQHGTRNAFIPPSSGSFRATLRFDARKGLKQGEQQQVGADVVESTSLSFRALCGTHF